LVVPPLTHLLASLLWSPGNDGLRRMSPACFECPLIQPLTLIEITTYGFVAEPVLWQTSTFCPFVFWAGGAGGGGGRAGLAPGCGLHQTISAPRDARRRTAPRAPRRPAPVVPPRRRSTAFARATGRRRRARPTSCRRRSACHGTR